MLHTYLHALFDNANKSTAGRKGKQGKIQDGQVQEIDTVLGRDRAIQKVKQ